MKHTYKKVCERRSHKGDGYIKLYIIFINMYFNLGPQPSCSYSIIVETPDSNFAYYIVINILIKDMQYDVQNLY